MKHEREMIRWAKSPDGTKVWARSMRIDWELLDKPTWNKHYYFIVDDEFAEIRKAYTDNKKIQVKVLWSNPHPNSACLEWQDFMTDDIGNINGSHNGTKEIYRLKPDTPKYQFVYKTKGMNKWEISRDYYLDHADFHAKFVEAHSHELQAIQIDQSMKEF